VTPGRIGRPERLRVAVPAVVALGANLGDREATIAAAVDELGASDGIRVDACSRLFETPALKPYGVDHDAPAYLNAVALVTTSLEPRALLDVAHAIEQRHGRVREERWGDRTLDVDIVEFASLTSDDPELTLPHPRAWERAFVLAPWLDVDPHASLTGHGSVAELLAATREHPVAVAPAPATPRVASSGSSASPGRAKAHHSAAKRAGGAA